MIKTIKKLETKSPQTRIKKLPKSTTNIIVNGGAWISFLLVWREVKKVQSPSLLNSAS